MRLSVIVPSSGRGTLAGTVASVAGQLVPGDELLVDVNDDDDWGSSARQRRMETARGDALLFQDDDDVYALGALDGVRRELEAEPGRPHIFRMRYRENDFLLWQDREVRCGNVASQMLCVPNIPGMLGRWTSRYESDFDFISETCRLMGEPVWHEDVISLVHHPQLDGAFTPGVVITTCEGREDNLRRVVERVGALEPGVAATVVVFDGCDSSVDLPRDVLRVAVTKHAPGDEQPRNVGFRVMREAAPNATHCLFLDSDMVFEPDLVGAYEAAAGRDPEAVLAGPYDWLPPGETEPDLWLRNDPRWPAFDDYSRVRSEAGAGIACFGGNIVYPIPLFERLGGYDANLHHGRCEDGELGLRVAEAGERITLVAGARAWHVSHPVDLDQVYERNRRDVTLLFRRHRWIAAQGFRRTPFEGARLEWVCPDCRRQGNAHLMWEHNCD